MGLANLEFVEADAERLEVGTGAFDAGLCRWGLMLMPNPVAAARQVHAALRPGARFAAELIRRVGVKKTGEAPEPPNVRVGSVRGPYACPV